MFLGRLFSAQLTCEHHTRSAHQQVAVPVCLRAAVLAHAASISEPSPFQGRHLSQVGVVLKGLPSIWEPPRKAALTFLPGSLTAPWRAARRWGHHAVLLQAWACGWLKVPYPMLPPSFALTARTWCSHLCPWKLYRSGYPLQAIPLALALRHAQRHPEHTPATWLLLGCDVGTTDHKPACGYFPISQRMPANKVQPLLALLTCGCCPRWCRDAQTASCQSARSASRGSV